MSVKPVIGWQALAPEWIVSPELTVYLIFLDRLYFYYYFNILYVSQRFLRGSIVPVRRLMNSKSFSRKITECAVCHKCGSQGDGGGDLSC